MCDISVIIPIYNVSSFIGRCTESLFRQTKKDGVEYIFVNDNTPDDSVILLKKTMSQYPDLESFVRIVSHPINKGLPSARNTGMAYANGEYIYHCDSDDWLETDLLEKMFQTAKKADADFVWCDFFLSFEKSERKMITPTYSHPHEALNAMLSGDMKYNVWNKLVKRDLYVNNDISFPDGHGMGEDMTMIRLAACAKRVAHAPYALYHYVKMNGAAFTQTTSTKHLDDIRYNANETISFIMNRYGSIADESVALFKLNVKWPFLISDRKEDYIQWREWYPEVNASINRMRVGSFRKRVLLLAASKGAWGVVWLHYKIVYKFVYGVLYR